MNIHRPNMKRWVAVLLAAALLSPMVGGQPRATHAQGDSQTFPQTGKTVSGTFLTYWNNHGGLAQQGYPISDQMQEVSSTDGKTYTVQYFERAVFEMHPENQPPYDVLLSLLGTFLYNQKYPTGAPNQMPNNEAGSQLFAATGHRVGGLFLDYWNNHGGLAQQGYPISDEFQETSDLDGKTYKVQYFERAVFEAHPENQPPYNVLLSQLGTFRYRAKYLQPPAPTSTPAAPVAGPTATSQPSSSPVGTIDRAIHVFGHEPTALAYGAGSLWTALVHGSAIERIDPATGDVVATIKVDRLGLGVVATDQAVWATTGDVGANSTLLRIDPASNQVVSTLAVGQGDALALDGGALWVGSLQQGNVMRVDPQSNKVVATVPVFDASKIPGGADVGTGPSIAAGNGQVWVADPVGKAVVLIDPKTNTVADRVSVGITADALSMLGSSLWVASFADNKVVRVDLNAKKVVASFDTQYPTGLLATENAVWIASIEPDGVTRVDPATNSVVGTIAINANSAPQNLVAAQGAIWVSARSADTILKIVPAP